MTPKSIKSDNGPAYISKQFKQFLHSFSIKQITDIPYNPQTQDIVKQTHYTLKLQIKNQIRGNTQEHFYLPYPEQTLLDSDAIYFFKPITIVNIALFVLNFLNVPQGDILTRAEKHFKELKDSSSPLPIWYQDRLNKQWKSGKLILQGKGYACISPDESNELTWLPLRKI